MAKETSNDIVLSIIPKEAIISKIYYIGGKKVMLDSDLATLYGVNTKVLNQAVKRNIERFPGDFMFKLSDEEFNAWQSSIFFSSEQQKRLALQSVTSNNRGTNLKSQIVTSSWGGKRKLPYVFTEQGVAMLSSVLRSKRAI